MSSANNCLQFNLIGKYFLRRKALALIDDSLVIIAQNEQVSSCSFKDCKQFAVYVPGLLGGVLTISVGSKIEQYRFLSKHHAEVFVALLNGKIADFICGYLSQVFQDFNSFVVNRYPRDSWLDQITALCAQLAGNYSQQQALWDAHLAPDFITQVKEIVRFHPVQPEAIREYHESHQLKKRSSFFDRVESNPLTHEQRLGVLRSNDKNMVLAAAGTGKTSVMVAKALDLIDRGLAKPSEILVLAYNKTAAEELKQRLEEKAKKGGIELQSSPHISTFHALGRKLLRECGVPTYMSVFTEDNIKLKQWVTDWLTRYLLSDNTRMLSFISLFPEPVNPFDFKSNDNYERYVRDNEFRTLNGEKVKGYQELQIANFLVMNGINYRYEPPYVSKRRIEIGFDYRPDFHVCDTHVYIEHFGIDREGKTRPDIDYLAYNESMKKKRLLHAECETRLIETFHYEWLEGTLESGLGRKLADEGIALTPIDLKEIFKKLEDEGLVATWSDLLVKALQAIRVERLSDEAIHDRLKQSGIAQPKKIADILGSLHRGYTEELKSQNAIDFDDMIIRATDVVNEAKYTPEWTYILVDEFQDISAARMEFIEALIDKGPCPTLTVVGDDWQSIYRFSGGKLELTTRFGKKVGSYTETKLQKTFRYNNSIANTAGQFIMENPEQYKKYIETHTQVDSSQVYLLDDKVGKKDGVYERVEEVVLKIRENDSVGSIAVIARYNYLLNDARAVLKASKLLDGVHFWSFHKSKGLEADYCILIGFFQGRSGFPNENRDEAIVEALLPMLDSFKHSEERRLFYVGITRAKKKSYIIADPTAPSEFITELLAPKYDINIFSKAFQEQYRKIFKCPNCVDGYLRLLKGQYSDFYGCSTGLGCKVGKARVCIKCGAPSVDGRSASVCNNTACLNSFRICEQCGRPMKQREGRFGKFWGCSGYGIKDDQCKHTLNS
ncbi:UvrD-helicase domain-containing protein [Shewanella oncorhynchi]|uniref:UvrD-helicase domain-containing protein n=1 Tax=Shewanella oncorhynchi TaxID=2726434 RepID=UPI003D7A3299